jgi:mycofactocin system creatininase family protein
VRLGELTSPEVAARASRSVLAVPVGATEQHGPHLPLATDTDIATALADRLADAVDGVLVAPPLTSGSSGAHASFAGTLSVGGPVTEWTLIEIARSADSFSGVVLVSGHGGNAEAVTRAARILVDEGRRVLAWFPRIEGGDAHAGRAETSIMLALGRPVRTALASAGNTEPLSRLLPRLRRGGVAAVSPNGVLGDPEGASAAEGRQLLDGLVADLVASVAAWHPASRS